MTLLHISLIAGMATITVPIMLHLVGQRQPQMVDFPTLRFVRETRQEQSSSWTLRHLLLLLLRVLLLAVLAFALAQPRVHSSLLASLIGIGGIGLLASLASLVAAVALVSKRSVTVWGTATAIAVALWGATALWGLQAAGAAPRLPVANDDSPIAVAVVIDNGPTMTYKANNRQRLDAAKEMVAWLLDQMPVDSRIGVLGGPPVGSLSLDPTSAKTQVKIVEPWGSHVDLLSRTRAALDLVLKDPLGRKEVYVVTDLNTSGWNGVHEGLAELLQEYRDEVLLQIIDVGDDAVVNWQLGNIESDFYTVPAGGSVTFQVPVQSVAPELAQRNAEAGRTISVSIELWQEEYDPRLPEIVNGELRTAPSRIVDRQVLDMAANAAVTTTLTASNLPVGTHHFTIRLDQPDPLLIDNQRFATVVAREQQPTLIVTSDSAMGDLLRLLVNPFTDVERAGLVEDIRYVQLSQVELGRYKVICLYDPPLLSPQVAARLREHVEQGGGLLNILGPAMLGSTRGQLQSTLGTLLPLKSTEGSASELVEPTVRMGREGFAVPVALTHPVFAELSVAADEVPWNLFPVFKTWSMQPLADNASVLMKLNVDELPLLIAHRVGTGQVLTFTTPVPEPQAAVVGGQWNELWIASDPWPAYGVLLGAFQTLSGADQTTSIFRAGEPVQLPNDPVRWPSRYELFTPNAQSRRVDAGAGSLQLGMFYQPGIYRLRGQRQTPIARGFSINAVAEDTGLSRMTLSQLDERLGAGNYSLARERDEVESSVGHARHGRELYSMMMLIVASLFLAEQAMSNRFYQVKFGRRARA
jgi:hypothetical protein